MDVREQCLTGLSGKFALTVQGSNIIGWSSQVMDVGLSLLSSSFVC